MPRSATSACGSSVTFLTGWDGSNPLDNPTNLFYQIVDRFAPHVIAHIFFGHTHEDQFNLFYANNATSVAADKAKAVSFMAPSVTPGNNVNPALRIMHVNATTYEVMDYHQFYTQVPTFPQLPSSQHGPVFEYLYSARDAYGNFTASNANSSHPTPGGVWPANAPLNATFWAKLTEEMHARPNSCSSSPSSKAGTAPKVQSAPTTSASRPRSATCSPDRLRSVKSAPKATVQSSPELELIVRSMNTLILTQQMKI